MNKSVHYYLTAFVLVIMLFSHAVIPGENNGNKAIFGIDLSESRIAAGDSNGDVDDLLIHHYLLPNNVYLSFSNIPAQQSAIGDFSLPIRARAPPLA